MKLIKYDPNRYTEESVKFVNQWILGTSFSKCEIIGVYPKKGRRGENYLFYRNKDGSVYSAVIQCDDEYGRGYKPCFFGSIRHFAYAIFCGVHGWKFYKQAWYDLRGWRRIKRVLCHTFNITSIYD